MSATQSVSDEHRLYGELICSFANAKTSDEAGKEFLENMKLAFNLTIPKNQLNDLYAEDNEFPTTANFMHTIEHINENMQNVFDNLKKGWEEHHCEEDYIRNFDNRDLWQSNGLPNIDVRSLQLDKIFARKETEQLMQKLSNDEQLQIRGIAEHYFCVLTYEHNYILNLRNLLKFILNAIVENKTRNEDCYEFTMRFSNLLQIYNEMKSYSHYIYGSEDNCLILKRKSYFNAYFFLNRFESMPFYNLKEYYAEPISYCLIEFLIKTENQKYLKKCIYCEDFFIAKHKTRKLCYPPKECETENKKKWQRNFMSKKRDKNGPDFDSKYI